MSNESDINELALKLGISADRFERNMATYRAMTEVFPLLEIEECKVGLFGGTALNKIYFGKEQRLSYDIDIMAYSYDKTVGVLERGGATVKYAGAFPGRETKSTKMLYKGIELDILSVKRTLEEPKKVLLTDLLFYYGQHMPQIAVHSYSIEYLMAEKLMAMGNRNELKDIYDSWLGTKLLKNKKQFSIYLKKNAKTVGIENACKYLDIQIEGMLANEAYYKKKNIEVVYQPDFKLMLRDIRVFIGTLGNLH